MPRDGEKKKKKKPPLLSFRKLKLNKRMQYELSIQSIREDMPKYIYIYIVD